MVLKLEFEQSFEHRFRELAMRKYGFSRGSITKASQEAITKWVNEQDKTLPKPKDLFKSLKGCMKNLKGKYDSVELQHEAVKLWAKKR